VCSFYALTVSVSGGGSWFLLNKFEYTGLDLYLSQKRESRVLNIILVQKEKGYGVSYFVHLPGSVLLIL